MKKEFKKSQLIVVTEAAQIAEELVSNSYKMSASQWLHPQYDIKTIKDLSPDEIIEGPFAQVVRYEGKKKESVLGSSAFDFYKICIQDHAILNCLAKHMDIKLYPFMIYVIVHELIHIVRFRKFLQRFDADLKETELEERRVHRKTIDIIKHYSLNNLLPVLLFFKNWHSPVEGFKIP